MKETQIYYSQSQFARLMGVSRQTVWNWIKNGNVKTVIVAGKKVIPAEVLKPQERKKNE